MATYSPALCLILCVVVCIQSEAAHPKGDDSCVDAAGPETSNGNLHLLQVGLSMETKREFRLSALAAGVEKVRASALATLSKCSGHLSKGSPVVATLFDSKYSQLALPWATRMRQFGYPNLVIASLDSETFANMSSLFADEDHVCVVPFTAPPNLNTSDGRIPTLVGQAKFDIVATLTQLGHECIISEADVFWWRSPRAMLHSFDLVKSIGGSSPSKNPFDHKPISHLGLNIGLVYVRPTAQATSFFQDAAQDWFKILVSDKSRGQVVRADQDWFNEQLSHQPLDLWGTLPGVKDPDCDRSAVRHLIGWWRRPKVEILQDLYAGVLTCSDLINLSEHRPDLKEHLQAATRA